MSRNEDVPILWTIVAILICFIVALCIIHFNEHRQQTLRIKACVAEGMEWVSGSCIFAEAER